MLSCLFVLTYATCEPNKQYAQLTCAYLVCVCHIKSSHSVSATWAGLLFWWGIVGGVRAHVCRPASRFLHHLKWQPVIILGFRADRLSIWVDVVAANWVYHLRFNHATHGRLTSNLGLNRALAVDLRYSSVCCCRLVHEHHLVWVRWYLATCPLV